MTVTHRREHDRIRYRDNARELDASELCLPLCDKLKAKLL